jgi:plastocyanin
MKGSTMYNSKRFCLFGLMIMFASLYLAACQSATPASFDGASTPGISINITDKICPSLTVTANDQITWNNQGQRIHMVRIESSEGKMVFDSGDLQPGDTASFIFPQAGNYVYVCSSDQKSAGTITIEP